MVLADDFYSVAGDAGDGEPTTRSSIRPMRAQKADGRLRAYMSTWLCHCAPPAPVPLDQHALPAGPTGPRRR